MADGRRGPGRREALSWQLEEGKREGSLTNSLRLLPPPSPSLIFPVLLKSPLFSLPPSALRTGPFVKRRRAESPPRAFAPTREDGGESGIR